MNRLPWNIMGSKNSSENHSLRQEKAPWKLRITIQLLIVSGGKIFAISKEALWPTVFTKSSFILFGRTDNSQHLTRKPPNRLVGSEISITIPHAEGSRRYPTPALLPALGVESRAVVWFSMAKPSFPRLGLSSPRAWAELRRCERCCLWIPKVKLHQLYPSPSFLAFDGKQQGRCHPNFSLNVCQAPLNQLRYFNHSKETSYCVMGGK